MKLLKIIATTLVIFGVLLLSYSFFQYVKALNQTEYESPAMKNTDLAPLHEKTSSNHRDSTDQSNQSKYTDSKKTPNTQSTLLYPVRPQVGETIGTLYIPSINASLSIIHGTDEEELEKGVGHYKGSVLPGEADHSILSGHRDTVFRKLEDVVLEDLIIVTTSAGTFTYQVVDIYIVDKDDRSVIRPTPEATLSLTTCYPFSFIGDAPDRYIIHAKLIDSAIENN
jgi:sortase A